LKTYLSIEIVVQRWVLELIEAGGDFAYNFCVIKMRKQRWVETERGKKK
jgi:hypothetical protein